MSDGVEGRATSQARVNMPDTAVGSPERKRAGLELKKRRLSTETTPTSGAVRSDSDSRPNASRRLSATPATNKKLSQSESTALASKRLGECSVEELEIHARMKRREEMRVALRENKLREKREMQAASQVSSAARPVRALPNGGGEASGKTGAALKPGLLKRTNGTAVDASQGAKRIDLSDGKEKGSAASKLNGSIPRIPKMARTMLSTDGISSPTRLSTAWSATTSPPPSRYRSPPRSPPTSPRSSLPSVLSNVPSAVLVAQLGEISSALTTTPPAPQRCSSLPISAPSAHFPSPAVARSSSASDAPQSPHPAQADNVLLMGDAALAFSLVLLDHRPTSASTVSSALHPPSLTCSSTPFLSLLSCHPRLYCVPASSELTSLLPLSLTCGHLKGKRLYLRQDVDPLQLSDSFPALRFGCVQLSLGSEGENTEREVQLMEQLLCSVTQVMGSEGVLRWTVIAQPPADSKRTEDAMRQRGATAGLQLVSVERTYLGSLQPPTAVDDLDAAHAREDREKVRGELTAYMGGETYVFTRVPPAVAPQPSVPSVAMEVEKTDEERRTAILDRLRRERADEKERQVRDLRAREKYATLVKLPSTEVSMNSSLRYHQAPLPPPSYVPRFDADKSRYAAQAFLQHRLTGHGSMQLTGQGQSFAYVR